MTTNVAEFLLQPPLAFLFFFFLLLCTAHNYSETKGTSTEPAAILAMKHRCKR